MKETPVVPATPAPAPVAAAAPAPAPYIEDEKKFDADAFDDELPPFEDKKPAPQEQIDMSKFIAEEKVYAPVEEEKPVAPAPVPAYVQPEEPAPVEEKHYIEPENNDNFVDDSWGKAKINLKPKKAAKEETTEEPEVAAEEPAPAKKKATKKKAEVTEEAAPAKKAPAKKKHLPQGRCFFGADNGSRTHLCSLGSCRSTDELYPRVFFRGLPPGNVVVLYQNFSRIARAKNGGGGMAGEKFS